MCCCCYPGSCLCGQHQADTPDEGFCRCKCKAFRRFQLLGSIGATLENEMSRSNIKESVVNPIEELDFGDANEDGEDVADDEDPEDVEDYKPLRKRGKRIKY